MRNQWLTRNPAKYVAQARDERPPEQRRLDMDVLTPKEVAALREAATPASYRGGELITNNYRLLISFAVFTGCRVGEILGAAWGHIDWDTGQFHIRRTFKEGRFQEPKTRTSYRRLSLPTFLLKELEVWRLACPSSPYDLIFPNLDGKPMSHSNLMTRGFHPALKRAGIRRVRFHEAHVREPDDQQRRGHRPRVEAHGTLHRVFHAECLQPHAAARARCERRPARILGFWKQNGNCCQSANTTRAAERRKLERISVVEMVARGGIEPPTRGFSVGSRWF